MGTGRQSPSQEVETWMDQAVAMEVGESGTRLRYNTTFTKYDINIYIYICEVIDFMYI